MKTFDNGGPDEADEMLMIEPPSPRSTISLPKIWQARNMLFRFTERIRSHSSSVISKKGVPELMPGALQERGGVVKFRQEFMSGM